MQTKKPVVDIVEVVRHGDRMIIPEKMDWASVARFAQIQEELETQTISFSATIPVFPYEGAWALQKVLEEKFGYITPTETEKEGLFGKMKFPPKSVSVATSPTESTQILWGSIAVPGVDGTVMTAADWNQDLSRFVFSLRGEIKRRSEALLNSVVEAVKEYLKTNSLFRERAWRLSLYDDQGDAIEAPMPEFLKIPSDIEKQITFSHDVQAAIDINLWSLIEHREKMQQVGFPSKWGVILAGPYGVGKTMAAAVTALKCVRNGWTFINVEEAKELTDILRLARDYEPAVVFCEDIDRVTSSQRTEEMDHLLNVIDGVESKDSQIIIVLTTNDVDSIHPSLLRPGRLDAVINVKPPDKEAVKRLIHVYGKGLVLSDADLEEVALRLEGEKTAVIRAVVEKAKSAWIIANPDMSVDKMLLNSDNLLQAVDSMRNQLDLLNKVKTEEQHPSVIAANIRAGALDRFAQKLLDHIPPGATLTTSEVISHEDM